jgi:ribosomal protein S18 acetylase RimI-like enzyme
VTGLNALQLPAAAARELEELALRAWPARLVQPLSGWRLAFTDGLTRRLNSVQAIDWDADADLAAALDGVEAFYTARGLPVRFRLTAMSRPAGLDDDLAARGYTVEAPSDVMVAAIPLASTSPPAAEVALASAPSPAWLGLWLAGDDADPRRRAILERMTAATTFGSVRVAGETVGLGLMAVERGFAGIFAMQIRPPFRRLGLARALLHALAGEAHTRGVQQLYLQVEQDNEAALTLYRQAGFRFAYSYHYRTGERPTGNRTSRR